MSVPEIDWNVPLINGFTGFFSEESLNKYQFIPSSEGMEKLENQEEPTTTGEKAVNSPQSQKKKNTPVKRKIRDYDQPNSTKRTIQQIKSKLPRKAYFPRQSSLNKVEQKRYLELYGKFSNYVPSQPNMKEITEINKLHELQIKVAAEQKEYLSYIESQHKLHKSDYEYIHPEAKRYTEEYLEKQQKRVTHYPRFYNLQEDILLFPTSQQNVDMQFVRPLLQMGEIPTIILPNINDVKSHVPCDYNKISKIFPPNGARDGSKQMYCKEPCSRDTNALLLAEKYQTNIVISAAALNCLVDNEKGKCRQQWEIPVVVKQIDITSESGEFVKQKVVFIDNPLLTKELHCRQKNVIFHKYGLRCLISRYHHGKGKGKNIGGRCKKSESSIAREQDDEDIFDSCGETSMHETFGLEESSTEQKNFEPPVEKSKQKRSKIDLQRKLEFVRDSLLMSRNKKEECIENQVSISPNLKIDNVLIKKADKKIDVDEDNEEKMIIAADDSPVKPCVTRAQMRKLEHEKNQQQKDESEETENNTNKESRRRSSRRISMDTTTVNVQENTSDLPTKRGRGRPKKDKSSESVKPFNDVKPSEKASCTLNLPEEILEPESSPPDDIEVVCSPKIIPLHEVNEVADNENVPLAKHIDKLDSESPVIQAASTLDQILASQKEMLDPMTSAAKKQHEGDNNQSISTEDPSKYCHPVTHNVRYDLWKFGQLSLLVRCNIHGMAMDSKSKHYHVGLQPKLEYQPQYGVEQVTYSETARTWMTSFIRQSCNIIRARINAYTSEIMAIEELDHNKILYPGCTFKPDAAMAPVYSLLNKLSTVNTGNYMLCHSAGELHCQLMVSTTAQKRGSYDLHYSYMGYMGMDSKVNPSLPQWIPVDPNVLLPYHKRNNRIPCTFEPREEDQLYLSKKRNKKRKKK